HGGERGGPHGVPAAGRRDGGPRQGAPPAHRRRPVRGAARLRPGLAGRDGRLNHFPPSSLDPLPNERDLMRTAGIQRRWLTHFSDRGHTVVPSAPLISPDPSILFTIAGMVPFIPYIVGTETPPWRRAVSVQKCIRTNDIDNVGRTTRHGTFFQM